MRTKNILSIAAFFTAFAVSAAIASLFIPANTSYRATSCFTNHHKSATANSISALIRQDVSNGNERDRAIRRLGIDVNASFDHPAFDDYAMLVENYADASNNLDASEMPNDFRYAWHKHMKAWRDYSVFLTEIENSRQWQNSDFEKLSEMESSHVTEIDETWYEVLRVARRHGSDARGY